MGEFSIWHLIIIMVVVLIFFGPSRLPGLGNSLGKAIRGFKEGMKGLNDNIEEAPAEKPAQAAREALPPGQEQHLTEEEKAKTNKS